MGLRENGAAQSRGLKTPLTLCLQTAALITALPRRRESTHIEQTAARLNWPCVRINLDCHVSHIDLVGKETIMLKDGKEVEALFAARRTSGTTCSSATRRFAILATRSHAARGGTKNDGMSAP